MRVLVLLAVTVSAVSMAQVSKSATTVSIANCNPSPAMASYQVDVYRPTGAGPFGLVALGHGFQNSKDNMEVLARAIAAKGAVVVVPQFPLLLALQCGSSDHARNATILIAAIDQQIALGGIDAAKVGVGGHSAGGLSAFLAAAQRNFAAVALLDAVDSNGLGLAQAANVSEPTLFLSGESSTCNSMNNSAAWYAPKPGLKAKLKVVNANHCDPQDPISNACTVGCGGPAATSAARTAIFRRYTVAFFDRILNGVTMPCLEATAAADELAGLVSMVDFQLGGCGGGVDAGTVTDAGTLPDAGSTTPDAGTATDDAGTTSLDAGTTPDDAGTMIADAGETSTDAGTTPADGGTDEVTPPGGCGCTVVPSVWVWLVPAALLISRRRAR